MPLSIIEQETCSAIKTMARKLSQDKVIDWEQRRYETAKDILCHLSTNQDVSEEFRSHCVDFAIKYADELIDKLRNKTTKQ